MAKLTRITNKIFGASATATGDDPQIGQFGSALAGTYVGTTDIATIQNLPAWSQGWIGAVTPTDQFPPLPEMTGAMKVLSYQSAYIQQMGICEWDSATTYYTNSYCQVNGEVYKSLTNDNQGNNPLTSSNWINIPFNTYQAGSAISLDDDIVAVELFDKDKFTIVGSPTVTDEGIISGFSSSNYAYVPSGYITDATKPFSIRLKVNYQYSITSYNNQCFLKISGVSGWYNYLITDSSQKFRAYLKFTDDTTTTITPNYVLTSGKNYIVDLTWNGSSYTLTIFDESGAQLSQASYSTTLALSDLTSSSVIYIGYDSTSGYINRGSIDLRQFSITVNGTEVVNGGITIYEALKRTNNSKLDKDHSNDTKPYLKTTYINGASGYNIWSNGYCEQWGTSTSFESDSRYTTITYLKTFANTNYCVLCQGQWEGMDNGRGWWVYSKTVSTVRFASNVSSTPFYWIACGYLASGQY